ncbi:translation initiation factor [Candidatus Woesearchaeota archaeon]|nr:MAG: translation initiation factor 1 [archaeon GW2011_AR4]MBS3129184.1 translation initiation factor [Candidatus Woesearchaeota archaeon]
MEDIDPITGLPKELGIWEDIAKEGQDITIKIVKKKFGKEYTIIDGLDGKRIDLKDLNKKLKSKFACGGTIKDKQIELQGNHKNQAKQYLVELGFSPETIQG